MSIFVYKHIYQEEEDSTMMYRVNRSIRKCIKEHEEKQHGGTKKDK